MPQTPRGAGRSRPLRWLVVGALLLFLVAGRLLVVERPIADPELIVMLTGHEWERLPATVDAARRYPGALVAVSMPAVVTQYNCHNCAGRLDQLAAEGVAPRRLVALRPLADNTRGEAEAVSAYVRTHGIRRVVAVTSVYHTRRTAWLFRRALPDEVAVGVESSVAFSRHRPWAWWSRWGDVRYVAYEWAALARTTALWPWSGRSQPPV